MTQPNSDRPKSTLIFIRGLPGSGKSYLSRRLIKQLGEDRATLLDPDSVDQSSDEYKQHVNTQIREGVDPKLHLYRFSRAQAFDAIKAGKIALWNQPFSDTAIFDKVTERFRSFAAENNIDLSIFIIEVNTDPQIAKNRVDDRKARGGHGPSSATFERFVNNFASFKGRGYTVIQVNGEDPAKKSIKTILTRINEPAMI